MRLPIDHEESGDRTNVKQCDEQGGVPVNTLNSILKLYVVHTLIKYSLLVDRSYQDLLSVTFMPHGWKISSTNLILQAAMLVVSATTHICIVTVAN
jgi:hypothetical protein